MKMRKREKERDKGGTEKGNRMKNVYTKTTHLLASKQ